MNRRIMTTGALCLSLLPGLMAPAGAEGEKEGDKRVGTRLDELKYNYKMSDDADFRLIMEYDDKRTQLVVINSNTEKYGKFEIREVYSRAFKQPGPLSEKLANRLLLDNEARKIGSWRAILGSDGATSVFYCAQLDANADSGSLKDAVSAVGITADELEKELTTGKDEF